MLPARLKVIKLYAQINKFSENNYIINKKIIHKINNWN